MSPGAVSQLRRAAWLGFFVVTMLAIVHVAWLCDDAFISARVADNFLSGFGLRYNPPERVQAYTHPLWLGLMIAARCVLHDPYWSLLGLSIFFSALSLAAIVWTTPRSEPFLAGVAVTLAFSKSFVEYQSSGLENPLTNLLLILSWREALRKPSPSLFKLSGLACLAALNRMDLLLLFAPPVLALSRTRASSWLERAKSLLLGFCPLAAWELFSLVYYGSLVPNTAIAKLGSDLPRTALLEHGLAYLLQPTWNDPISLLLLLTGLPLGLLRGTSPVRGFCAGALLYIGYVVWIGGDFMAGRFLSAPVLVAVLSLLELLPVPHAAVQLALGGVVLGLSFVPLRPIWAAPLPAEPVDELWLDTCLDGVCDERAFYGGYTHWRHVQHGAGSMHKWATRGAEYAKTPDKVPIAGAIGFRGFFAGPAVFLIDYYGLSDPLLARLPPYPKYRNWKPGHGKRCVPAGYPEAVRFGPSRLEDAPLRQYYSLVWLATRGELWSLERWRAIWKLNTSESRFKGGYTCRAAEIADAPAH